MNKQIKYRVIENGRVLHTGDTREQVEQWAFVLRNTQGRDVVVREFVR